MMKSMEAYKAWAPDDALWAQWVKPVLFTCQPYKNYKDKDRPRMEWKAGMDYEAAVVIDLPGNQGVDAGLALALSGYRPVPLYNGVAGPNRASSLVVVQDVVTALFESAEALKALHIRSDAPPAFLLDSNRMNGPGKQPGKYDNRWCVFPQDMPSASFLQRRGIKRIIVLSQRIQTDLSHILRRYQEQGLPIYQCSDNKTVKAVTVAKPSRFRSLLYRFQVTMKLTRNAAGGFGGQIPEPSSGGYYGVG